MVSSGKIARMLWKGCCTVLVKAYETNEDTGVSEEMEIPVFEDEPCHLSFGSSPPSTDGSGANYASQTIKLFIGSALDIPKGSKIVVTQNGVTASYSSSGAPKRYSGHQEIELKEFKGWA